MHIVFLIGFVCWYRGTPVSHVLMWTLAFYCTARILVELSGFGRIARRTFAAQEAIRQGVRG